MLNWYADKTEIMQKTINGIYEVLKTLTESDTVANHWIDRTHNVFAMVNDNGDGDEWIEIHYELYDVDEGFVGDIDVVNTEDRSSEALIECIKVIVEEYYREQRGEYANKNIAFTEMQIWSAIFQASGECMDDCEYSGLLILAEAILGIPYNKIKAILDEEE